MSSIDSFSFPAPYTFISIVSHRRRISQLAWLRWVPPPTVIALPTAIPDGACKSKASAAAIDVRRTPLIPRNRYSCRFSIEFDRHGVSTTYCRHGDRRLYGSSGCRPSLCRWSVCRRQHLIFRYTHINCYVLIALPLYQTYSIVLIRAFQWPRGSLNRFWLKCINSNTVGDKNMSLRSFVPWFPKHASMTKEGLVENPRWQLNLNSYSRKASKNGKLNNCKILQIFIIKRLQFRETLQLYIANNCLISRGNLTRQLITGWGTFSMERIEIPSQMAKPRCPCFKGAPLSQPSATSCNISKLLVKLTRQRSETGSTLVGNRKFILKASAAINNWLQNLHGDIYKHTWLIAIKSSSYFRFATTIFWTHPAVDGARRLVTAERP